MPPCSEQGPLPHLVEAKCNRCRRISLVPLRAIKRPLSTPMWKLEPALYCEPCSDMRGRRQRPHHAADLCAAGRRLDGESATMNKFATDYANPEAAARKLVEIASGVKPVQDGRIYIERINAPFLFELKAKAASSEPDFDTRSRRVGSICTRVGLMCDC